MADPHECEDTCTRSKVETGCVVSGVHILQQDLSWGNKEDAEGQAQRAQTVTRGDPKNGIAVHTYYTQHAIN